MTDYFSSAPESAIATSAAAPSRLPRALVALGLLIYAVAGALSALLEILLVPLRAGSTLVPIAVVLAVASNILIPWLSSAITNSALGAAPPVVLWILTAFLLSSSRPEGDVLLPGGSDVQWVSYGVLFGGLFTGLITMALLASSTRRQAGG
jgi:hypothetical protein